VGCGTACGDDAVQDAVQRVDGFAPQSTIQLRLELGDRLEGGRDALSAPVGEDDALGSSIVGIWTANDVA
jgi:hypothetical protein